MIGPLKLETRLRPERCRNMAQAISRASSPFKIGRFASPTGLPAASVSTTLLALTAY
jgi:hypothetical protein